jgi:hypothetical protein
MASTKLSEQALSDMRIARLMPDAHDLPTAPPLGASEGDDPRDVDRYNAEQFVLSVAQVYDTAWPLSPEPA